jgi:hypothetical protein
MGCRPDELDLKSLVGVVKTLALPKGPVSAGQLSLCDLALRALLLFFETRDFLAGHRATMPSADAKAVDGIVSTLRRMASDAVVHANNAGSAASSAAPAAGAGAGAGSGAVGPAPPAAAFSVELVNREIDDLRGFVDTCVKKYGGKLSDEERRSIVAAVGSLAGSWYRHQVRQPGVTGSQLLAHTRRFSRYDCRLLEFRTN